MRRVAAGGKRAERASTRASAASRDDMYNEAVEVVLGQQRGSATLLQRALSVGYTRATRLLELMEADGLVKSTLVPSNEGPARKCFTLTAEGKRVLAAWCETWKSTNKWVNRVLGGIDGIR